MRIDNAVKNLDGRKARKRVGRGSGSGHGKTSGRGQKGAGSRSGYSKRAHFEGGQMPLFRRIPKRGFSNADFETVYSVINVGNLKGRFAAGDTVDLEGLKKVKLVRKNLPVKLLGQGDIDIALNVKIAAVSKSASEKIAAAGGSVEIIKL